jgi:cobalt-zinc-cadmium efflux system outer membrane protein
VLTILNWRASLRQWPIAALRDARATLAVLFLCSVFASALPAAEPSTVMPQTLTLRAALDRAQRLNLELRALEFESRALAARREQANVRPNPTMTLAPENVLGTGDLGGVKSAEWNLALSQVFERGDKRSRRVALVDAQSSVAQIYRAARRVDLLAYVTRTYIELVADQERLQLARRSVDIASQTLAAVDKRVRAGASPAAEAHRARVTLARAQLDEQRANYERQVTLRRLAATWGATEPDFDSASADLYAFAAVPAFKDFLARLPDSAELVRFANEERLRSAEVRLEQARRQQDITLSAGVRRLQGQGDQALILSFSLPLAINDRNTGAIREAEVRRDQVDAQRDAAVVRIQTELYALFQELQQARGETLALRSKLLPELEQALSQTEYAYQRGRYSYLELIDAQRALLDVQRQSIDAAARYHTFVAEIERLTGAPLTDTTP